MPEMDARFLRNVVLKGLVLFLVMDLMVAMVPAGIGTVSLYNTLFAGRLRFPFGEDSDQSYNMSLFDLDAMFSSHIIHAGTKPLGEFRVIVVGDSSIWGTLLHPEETLSGLLDASGLVACDGRELRVYNLGYPTLSLTKDLMVLDQAMRYRPDLILWALTLESFPLDKQLSTPIVANNPALVDDLIMRYDLSFDPDDPALVRPTFWGRTMLGQRRSLADLIRLQLYGILWSATGIDQSYPGNFTPAQTDFDSDVTFHGQSTTPLDAEQMAFELLEAGMRAAGDTPVLLINEPILISTGENSDLRYNFLYPRWAFDEWREMLVHSSIEHDWHFLDLWDLVPADHFTNSAIHLSPQGETLLLQPVTQAVQQFICP